MQLGAIELRDGRAIAEVNAEINKRRLETAHRGGPLRVTDPAAFAKLMEDMKRKAEEQRTAEAQREAERAKREGANYKTKEEREKEARNAKQQPQEEDEARHMDRKFDPNKNYYQLLGLDRAASTAEIKRAYKKLALAYHPDKHKTEDAEQQAGGRRGAAVGDKFKEVVEAFDVLSDESLRAVYDKIRDHKEANPGGSGLPVLSPEELAMMRSGAAELRRLRKMGNKLTKHKPLEKEVWVSLEKLNSGGTKRVGLERQRVDANGIVIQQSKTFYLVIRKGMQEGDRLTFEGEGEEAVDTQPGDLHFVLRQKPHPVFKRSGRANLELFARALAPGDLFFAVSVNTLQGKQKLLTGSAFHVAASAGGAGGMWRSVVKGQGLWDPQDPWDLPPGDLIVQVRYPGFQLGREGVRSSLRPQPVYLLGSAAEQVPAAMVGGCLVAALAHRLAAEELLEEGDDESELSQTTGAGSGVGECGSGCTPLDTHPGDCREVLGSSGMDGAAAAVTASTDEASVALDQQQHQRQQQRTRLAVCVTFQASQGALACPGAASPAAQALLAVLRKRVAGLQSAQLTAQIAAQPATSQMCEQAMGAPSGPDQDGSASSACGTLGLMDDEWCLLHEADILMLDISAAPGLAPSSESGGGQEHGSNACLEAQQPGTGQPADQHSSSPEDAAAARVVAVERLLGWVQQSGEGAALAEALWSAFWRGSHIVAVGGACALLGRQYQHSMQHSMPPAVPPAALAAILPWYLLRAGGGKQGWEGLHAAMQGKGSLALSVRSSPSGSANSSQAGVVGVGVMAGSAVVVDPWTGAAEVLVVPTRDTLVATALWVAANDGCEGGLQEADDDFGFFYACQPGP
ncbi:hypothetical protein N2152v2_009488 [Parachlorella kessleri]